MLDDLTQITGQRNWPVVCGVISITFLVKGTHSSCFPIILELVC